MMTRGFPSWHAHVWRSGPWLGHALDVVACLLALAGVCEAADDAGTTSVFAEGVGPRALALGSAFVAVADDPSAAVWNPGGLGWIDHTEVEVSYTARNLGFAETYVGLVIPSWRWGAAAFTFRHFGVDGIEQRDELNSLLDDSISDSEMEIGLTYGRAVSEALSVGGTIKLQQQSLAGFRGSGLGADAGVLFRPGAVIGSHVPWMDRWTWGLSVRNLLEPSIRLDRESAQDPWVLRTGWVYRHPVGDRLLLGTVEIERPRDAAARFHGGMEFRPHPLLSLRTGLKGEGLTAGAGIAWRNLSLDYAYENQPLGAAQWIGVSRRIGPSVPERRQAAQAKQERAAQARLDEAFQRRQVERINDLLVRAEEAHLQGDLDEALNLSETAEALVPDSPRARSLQVSILNQKGAQLERSDNYPGAAVAFGRALALAPGDSTAAAGQARCRAESDRRAARSTEIHRLFSAALDAFASGDLVKARSGFAAILAAAPSDSEATAMQLRTDQAIARRIEDLLARAARSIELERWSESERCLEEARRLDPGAPGLARAEVVLARARAAASQLPRGGSTVPIPQEPRRLTREQEREVEDLYQRGLAAMSNARPDDALRYWELARSIGPDPRVAEVLKREYQLRGIDSFASGRLEEALNLWDMALQLDPEDQRTQGYIARAQLQLQRTREITGGAR